MWCLGTWSKGGLGSVRLIVGFDDLKGLSNQHYSMKAVDLQGMCVSEGCVFLRDGHTERVLLLPSLDF